MHTHVNAIVLTFRYLRNRRAQAHNLGMWIIQAIFMIWLCVEVESWLKEIIHGEPPKKTRPEDEPYLAAAVFPPQKHR
jgi:hypothetical protein